MKQLNALAILLAAGLLAGCQQGTHASPPQQAQAGAMPGMQTGGMADSNGARMYHARGQVVKVNPPATASASGTSLTLDHEDIPDYMSAMRMTFPVADPAQVAQL